MVETTQFMFDLRDILADLIKRQGLRQGRWKIICELGFAGTNATVPSPEGAPQVKPAAMVIIQRVGLSKTDEVSNLTMDAAEVNPEPRKSIMRKPQRSLKAKK